jgi:hypothetical protein
MTSVRKILVCAAAAVAGLLVAAGPSQAHWPFHKHEPVEAPIYAAPEYGAPAMVPMGRNARYEYTYRWGVPSSQIRPIEHGQYAEVGTSAPYYTTSSGDCGGGCESKCGRKGCLTCGLFKHRGCNSGCNKGCGEAPCKSKCGGGHKCGLFGCKSGCNKGCDSAPKCEKPCHKPCSTPCRKTCKKPCHAKCSSAPKCGGCKSSSNCCFSLFGCHRHRCGSSCSNGAVWSEGVPSDAGAMPENAPAPPAEDVPPPVPQASHTIESNVLLGSAEATVSGADCAQPVKTVSHVQQAKCKYCSGQLRPLYGPKRLGEGVIRLVCPRCKKYYRLTMTPSPVTSTDQLGYYYARVPR